MALIGHKMVRVRPILSVYNYKGKKEKRRKGEIEKNRDIKKKEARNQRESRLYKRTPCEGFPFKETL